MEANRLGITREKSPMVIFTNKDNPFVVDMAIGERGQLDANFEVIKQSLEMDENDNEIIRFRLKIIKAQKLNLKSIRQ